MHLVYVCGSGRTFHFYSNPTLWMSIPGRQLVEICFERDQQKMRGVGKVFSQGSDKTVRW